MATSPLVRAISIALVLLIVNFISSSTAKCDHVLSSAAGWFTSPNHPENYPRNTNCRWLINATQLIMLSFTRFSLGTSADTLTVYDGPNESSPVLLEAWLNETVPSSIVSTGNQMLVTLTTDVNTDSGFNATYQPYYPGITTRPLECNGPSIFVDSSGYILTSLNFPFSYPNIRCQWQFVSEPRTTFKISFTDFSTRPEDYVSMFDGDTSVTKFKIQTKVLMESGINFTSSLHSDYLSKRNKLFVTFNPFSETFASDLMPRAGFRAILTPINTGSPRS